MNLNLVTGLLGGLIASVIFTIVCIGSYVFNKELWLPEISGGKVKAEWTLSAILWTAALIITVFGGSIGTAWWVAADGGTFWESALAAYWVQVVINLWDIIVIDVILYQWIQPSWMQFDYYPPIEGTWYHIKAGLNGLVLGVPFALLSALIGLMA